MTNDSKIPTAAFDRVVQLLKGATQTPRGVRALCPAHADSRPSLDCDLGDDGRVLLACRSKRCSTKAIVTALGITERDLFPNSVTAPSSMRARKEKTKHPNPDAATKAMLWSHREAKGRLTRHHDYHAADGLHVMRAMRFDFPDGSKKFGQAHRAKEGHWVNGGMPAPRPMFRLQELIAADPEEPVLIPEGEKCAEACVSIGFVATTSSQGSSAANKTDWSPLKGRRVFILPDNDASGRRYRDDVIRLAHAAGASSVSVIDLEGLAEGEDVFDWIQKLRTEGNDDRVISEQLMTLVVEAPSAAMPVDEPAAAGKPQIVIGPGRLGELVREAERALIRCDKADRIYQRGTQIVRVARVDEPTSPRHGTDHPAGIPRIMACGTTYLRAQFETAAQFLRIDENGMKDANCPADIPACYLQSAGEWRVPVLRAVVCAPTLRADGTVLQTPGYDLRSRLLYDPCDVAFATVPDQPTRLDAQAAAARILRLVHHFDFVDEGARSVWLSSLLSALVRPILPTAPMFVFDAPTRGSGKSKLATTVGIIATGRAPATMTLVEDVDETRKRIFALLLQGAAVINIDNVDVPVGGASLCTVLTEQSYSDRILGASEIVLVPTNSTWITTGNNVVIGGDLTRRVLVARLDPKCERPEERRFTFDPVQIAEKNRAGFVVDALTILRAHAVAGRPQCDITPFGSFEVWSEIIRAAIVWIGLSDPIQGRQAVVEQDGGAGAVAELLRIWHRAHGAQELTTRQLLNGAGQDLSDAVDEVIGSDVASGNRPRRLGQVLAQWRDRIVGGYQAIRGRDAHGGTSRWAVQALGDGGNGGNGWNPGANGGIPPAQAETVGREQGRTSAKVPTVPTVPTTKGHLDDGWPARPQPLNDAASSWTAGPDDGLPEQPGRRAKRRGAGGA